MNNYYVTYAIRGYFDVHTKANNLEEAKQRANEIMLMADFGEVIDPQSELLLAYKDDESEEIIRCGECKKHNNEKKCPMVKFRGKAKGYEFDDQFCSMGEPK